MINQEKLNFLVKHLINSGATRVLRVGGDIRDELLKLDSKDLDIEVYGLTLDKLIPSLEELGKVDVVGKSFGVLKFHFKGYGNDVWDISIPRRDSKGAGDKHKDIIVTGDPFLPLEEAFKRRDFTINAIGKDLVTGDIIDIYKGQEDLKNKIIRAVDKNTFTEDPLRVLRAMQFTGRFNFTIEPETVRLAKEVNLSELSKERVRDEIFKLLLKSSNPSIGFNTGLELNVMEKLFPSLYAMKNFPQNPEWHPEGCVWTHTMITLDHAVKLSENLDETRKLTLLLAALCHDIGKPLINWNEDNRTIGHDLTGAEIARNLLIELKIFSLGNFPLQDVVVALISCHMRPWNLWEKKETLTKRAWTKLRQDVLDETELIILLDLSDRLGRSEESKDWDEKAEWLKEQFKIHAPDETMKPLILGRHLLPLGYKASPQLGRELKRLYELQLEGKFSDFEEGLKLVNLPK